MGIMPDSSPYGSQTVTGPGWPHVDENALAAAAASYEALAAKLTGQVVPTQQGQLMKLSDSWRGAGALAATGEASTIIGGHEANAAQAAAIAVKLRTMEAAVVRTKTLANATAVETQRECEALQALPFSNTQQLLQSRIKLGLSQNTSYVTANTTEMAGTLGVPPNIPLAGGAPPTGTEKAEDQDPQQAMKSLGQMGSLVGQIPQQVGQLMGKGPGQLSKPLQQLSQPLQQLTSMFGQGGKMDAGGGAVTPFSSFSNHPLAGGSGASGGSGMVRAASVPGSGGASPRTPLMANLVGTKPVAAAVSEGAAAAGGGVGGGVAPVAGGGGMGGMGMMGARGTSGGTTPGLSVPAPLEHDLADDDEEDDW